MFGLGPACRAALGIMSSSESVDAQREHRANQRAARRQREYERHGQMRLPLQLFLPGMGQPASPAVPELRGPNEAQ